MFLLVSTTHLKILNYVNSQSGIIILLFYYVSLRSEFRVVLSVMISV